MKNKYPICLLLSIFVICNIHITAQVETITYSLDAKAYDKAIPFDKEFNLLINKANTDFIKSVDVFEVEYKHGKKNLKIDQKKQAPASVTEFTILIQDTTKSNKYPKKFKSVSDFTIKLEQMATAKDTIKTSVADFTVNVKNTPKGHEYKSIIDFTLHVDDTAKVLLLHFPPLKPSIDFDIAIVRSILPGNKKLIFKINKILFQGGDAKKDFYILSSLAEGNDFSESETKATYFNMDLNAYKTFYTVSINAIYTVATSASNYINNASISKQQLQALEIGLKTFSVSYNNGYLLNYAISNNQLANLQMGFRSITDFNNETNSELSDLLEREVNLKASIQYFDTLLQKIYLLQAKGIETVAVSSSEIKIEDAKISFEAVYKNLTDNYKRLKTQNDLIVDVIQKNDALSQAKWISGTTVAADLKTKGGNIFFLDFGFATLGVKNIRDNWFAIPKLYTGVSIYFRPIDKNTRRGAFPCSFKDQNKNGAYDHNICSRDNIWQRLCLNVGLTYGPMQNKEFDNLYNGTSLLIGPAIRFERAFKVSAGLSLMRGDSKNPFISEKKVLAGAYLSLSVDLDFIQGISDVKNMLLK